MAIQPRATRCSTPRGRRSPTSGCPTTSTRRPPRSARPACPRRLPRVYGGDSREIMAKPRLATGTTIDGFLIGEIIHRGGMAMLWQVTRDDIDMPMLMKVPRLFEGEDPAAIVGFEMEQMIL